MSIESDFAAAVQANPGLDSIFWVGLRIGIDPDILDELEGHPGGVSLEDALAFWDAGPDVTGTEPTPGETPQPRFGVGQVLWAQDGRSGAVLSIDLEPDTGLFIYFLSGLPLFFFEFELSAQPPPGVIPPFAVEPVEPLPDIITSEVLARVIFQLRQEIASLPILTRSDVRQIAEAARDEAVTISAGDAFGKVETLRFDLENSLQSQSALLSAQLTNLESTLTTELNEISNRQESFESELSVSSGLSFPLFVQAIGTFIRGPFDWFMDRASERILEEITDGLNR